MPNLSPASRLSALGAHLAPAMSLRLDTIAVVFEVSPQSLALIRKHFPTVHYYPNGKIPPELVGSIEVWFCNWLGIPRWIGPEMLTNTQVVQLTSGA